MKAPMKSYEMTKWPCLHFMKKNRVFMRKRNTGNTYERPFIKLVDLYTLFCRKVPYFYDKSGTH